MKYIRIFQDGANLMPAGTHVVKVQIALNRNRIMIYDNPRADKPRVFIEREPTAYERKSVMKGSHKKFFKIEITDLDDRCVIQYVSELPDQGW